MLVTEARCKEYWSGTSLEHRHGRWFIRKVVCYQTPSGDPRLWCGTRTLHRGRGIV